MEISLSTSKREEFVDITAEVTRAVRAHGLADGFALVYCPHTTAAITINENADPDVVRDLLSGLTRIAPQSAGWQHAEGNSDGHLKASLVGPSVTIPIVDGRLALGTWQGVYFCEFDGPRRRRYIITTHGNG